MPALGEKSVMGAAPVQGKRTTPVTPAPAPAAASPEAAYAGRAGDPSQASMLAWQGSAGNLAVVQRMGAGPHRHEPSGRPPEAGRGGTGTVQRAPAQVQLARLSSGKIAFTNLNQKNEKYREKATRVLQLLSSHESIQTYLGNRKCDIVIEQRMKETPADVVDRGAEGVVVTLAAYYFESYDIGYIAGMLAHEFAIHPMADNKPQLGQEEDGFKGLPFPVPGLEESRGGAKMMNSDDAKQSDHVLGAIPGSPRYEVYKSVALEMANLLMQDVENKEPNAKAQDVTDLLDCFLMDVASIAATNDDRLKGTPEKSGAMQVRKDIASVYNRYKALVSAGLPDSSPIKPFFPQDKTHWGVLKDFATLATRAAGGAVGAPSIDKGDDG
ncbi:hypothetical protein ACIQ7D_16210 [Streptomyces sp. NPDC096310]|uniref:hypothetical protein n=1 Tax=Streptomyces sp. NPDC096310 TaxID=3366082 RepID=UPI00381B46C8